MNGLIKTNANKNKFSGGQSGNAVILALMVCVMVAMMASTVPTLIGASEKQMRISRVKSVMTNLENRIRRIVMDPSTYLCPTNVSGYTTPSSCPLDLAKLNDLRSLRIPGPQQCAGPACINPQINFNFNLPGNTLVSVGSNFEFQGTISYNNVDVNIQPINLRIEVPVDVVNIKTINCGALYSGLRPIFGGLNSDGSPNCRRIDNDCGVGKYLNAVNPTNLSYTCESMDTSTLNCGAGQMLSNLNWSSGTYSGNCIPVPNNPFNLSVAFPYNPNICVGPNPCAPPAPPVNCAGNWGVCVAPGYQTFTITTPASGGGAPCPSPLNRACVLPPPGPVPPTAVAGCGPSANTVAYAAPTSGFCTAGSNLLTPPGVTYDLVNNQWFEWQCDGTTGPITCHTLHQNLPYNGDCDPNAIMGTHMVIPTNLCAAGYALPAAPNLVPVPPPPAAPTHQEWQWQCMGMSGGTNASCAAVKTSNDNGSCLTYPPAASTTPPDGVGCQTGTQSAVTVPTAAPWDYSWTCGTAPGTVVTCTSPMIVNGVCGSDNGQVFLNAPSTNLCAIGAMTGMTGSGPWNWNCDDINNGANHASCSASKVTCGTASTAPTTVAPTSNFCAAGTAANLAGTAPGPWTWNCVGSTPADSVACSTPPFGFTQNNCVDVTYTGTGDNLCPANQYVAGVQDSIGGIDRMHGMDGVVCCDSPPSVGYSSCEPRFSYTGTGQNFCSMGNVMLGVWDDGGGMDGMNGPVCCTPTLPVGRSNCVDLHYSGSGRNMCPPGKYAAGVHDNGGGMDGVNGIICCDP